MSDSIFLYISKWSLLVSICHHRKVLTVFPKLYISHSWLIYFSTERFVPLNLPHLFLLAPTPWYHLFVLSMTASVSFVHLFCYFSFHLQVKSSSICLCLSDLFHLAKYCLGPFLLSLMTRFHSFFMANSPQHKHTHHIFFIQPLIKGHLDCFHILAIVNNAAKNTEVHVSFQMSVSIFFRYIPRSGTAGSYSSSVSNILRNLHSVFCSGRINLLPTPNSAPAFPFIHILANTCHLFSFW